MKQNINYIFWNLEKLFSLSYAKELAPDFPTMEYAVRRSSTFNDIHVFNNDDFNQFGDDFLKCFNKSKNDLVLHNNLHYLELEEYSRDGYFRESKTVRKNVNIHKSPGVLKIQIINSELFYKVTPKSIYFEGISAGAMHVINYEFN